MSSPPTDRPPRGRGCRDAPPAIFSGALQESSRSATDLAPACSPVPAAGDGNALDVDDAEHSPATTRVPYCVQRTCRHRLNGERRSTIRVVGGRSAASTALLERSPPGVNTGERVNTILHHRRSGQAPASGACTLLCTLYRSLSAGRWTGAHITASAALADLSACPRVHSGVWTAVDRRGAARRLHTVGRSGVRSFPASRTLSSAYVRAPWAGRRAVQLAPGTGHRAADLRAESGVVRALCVHTGAVDGGLLDEERRRSGRRPEGPTASSAPRGSRGRPRLTRPRIIPTMSYRHMETPDTLDTRHRRRVRRIALMRFSGICVAVHRRRFNAKTRDNTLT